MSINDIIILMTIIGFVTGVPVGVAAGWIVGRRKIEDHPLYARPGVIIREGRYVD